MSAFVSLTQFDDGQVTLSPKPVRSRAMSVFSDGYVALEATDEEVAEETEATEDEEGVSDAEDLTCGECLGDAPAAPPSKPWGTSCLICQRSAAALVRAPWPARGVRRDFV